MLDHLRQRVIDLLEPTQTLTLSTFGPAGLQAQVLPGAALGLRLFVLVPSSSEHLFNLETEPQVVATTSAWQLRGRAREIPVEEFPPGVRLPYPSLASGNTLIEIRPCRIQVGPPNGQGFSETIDIPDEPLPS